MNETVALANLLALLASRSGRITLSEAERVTGRPRGRLLGDFEKLLMVGVPPYDPGSYVAVYWPEGGRDGVIVLRQHEHFRRPLNFTLPEALALRYALEHYASAADGETAREVRRLHELLRDTLSGGAGEAFREGSRALVMPPRTRRLCALLELLDDATRMGCMVELDYYSSHRDSLAARRVHPFELIERGTHWYLYAWCETACATRHFRMDRIREARLLDEPSTRRPPKDRHAGRLEAMLEGTARESMRVRFSREVAEEAAAEFEDAQDVKLRHSADGRLTVRMPLFNPFWAVGFIMSWGGHARLLEPAWLCERLTEVLRKSLDAHRSPLATPAAKRKRKQPQQKARKR
jgi:proteasome accessory factor C